MSRIALLSVASAAMLVWTVDAAAKEPLEAKVCGASGCEVVTDQQTLALLVEGDPPTTKTPAAAAFFTVTLTFRAEDELHSWTSFYIPAAAMLRGDNGEGRAAWLPLPAPQRAAFARITTGMKPFPRPRLTAVLVDGKAVSANPSSYLALFDLPAGEPGPPPSDWVSIDLRSSPPSPWTASERDLYYSPSTNSLERGGQVVALADGLAADVEAARPLAGDGSAFPWLVVGLGLLGAVALGVAVLELRRRGFLVLPRRPEVA